MRPFLQRLAALAARQSVRLSLLCLALLLVVLPTWLGSDLRFPSPTPDAFNWLDSRLYAGRFLWWGVLGFWLLWRWIDTNRSPWRWGPAFLLGPLLAMTGLSIVEAPLAVNPPLAQETVLHAVLLLGFYLTILNAPLSRGLLGWSLAAGVTIQALVAVPQFVLGHSLGLEILGEYSLDGAWNGASVVVVGEQRLLRGYGLTAHPNLLGGYLTASLLLLCGFYLGRMGRSRFLVLAALGFGALGLLVTFSRAAWLGAGVGGLVLVGLLRVRRPDGKPDYRDYRSMGTPLVMIALMVLGFAIANWPLLQPRLGFVFQDTEMRSIQERIALNSAAWSLIGQRPAVGVGPGNFAVAVDQLAQETVGPYSIAPAHNVPLLAAAELGLPGGLLWLSLLVAPWIALWPFRRRSEQTPWMAGLSGALAALTVVELFDYYLWISNPASLLLWLVWGLWAREFTTLNTRLHNPDAHNLGATKGH